MMDPQEANPEVYKFLVADVYKYVGRKSLPGELFHSSTRFVYEFLCSLPGEVFVTVWRVLWV